MPPSLIYMNPAKQSVLPSAELQPTNYPNLPTSNPKKQLGFTLLEIMITVAIGAIITTIALPALGLFSVKMRVDNEVGELQRLLLTARSAAINSGQNASLCPLQDNNSCQTGTGWNWTGRIGVVTVNGLIKERAAIKEGDQLDFDFISVTYNATGQLDNTDIDTFSYCPHGYSEFSRGVTLSLSGRTYVSTDKNDDDEEQDRNGNPIKCD